MTELRGATVLRPKAIQPRLGRPALAALGERRWKPALTVLAVVAAALAVWVTARADFLAHPRWLAVQKADFILGPILVGLYWMHSRPGNRLGLWLVVLGLLGIPYILESSGNPTLFGVGVIAEDPIYVVTTIVILMFPSGRLAGLPERLVIAVLLVTVVVVLAATVNAAHLAPGLSISECRNECPPTSLGLASPQAWRIPSLAIGIPSVTVALLTAGVIAWRFATGTPPRRRALAIGAPIAVLFLLVEAAYRGIFLFAPEGLGPSARPIQDVLQWSLAGTRALVWYGFLFALIAAQLHAGRVLRRLVGGSLGRPSFPELEGMVRGPLGDPGLRLGFWRPGSRDWVGVDGEPLEPPGAGQTLTEIDRDGPGVAIVHDKQLADDPELLQVAGAVALLSLENAELDAAWKDSLHALSDSRARLVQAGDRERRKLERDLHDGAQQRLMAIQVRLQMAKDRTRDQGLVDELDAISVDAEQAVEELRALAHGIYPPVLRSFGLPDALRALVLKAPIAVRLEDAGIGRLPRTVEAAIYFCASEAVQNAIKHAGDGARVTITLGRDEKCARFAVADDGVGMAGPASWDGQGVTGMRDRIGAAGGELEIVSAPGAGTTVRGTVPLDGESASEAWEVAG